MPVSTSRMSAVRSVMAPMLASPVRVAFARAAGARATMPSRSPDSCPAGGVGPRSRASRQLRRPSPAGTPRRHRPCSAQASAIVVAKAVSRAGRSGPSHAVVDTSARTRPPGATSAATPAMTRSSRPRTPASSEPHGRTTVTSSARHAELGGGASAAATTNRAFGRPPFAFGLRGTPGRLDHRRRRWRRCRCSGSGAPPRRGPARPGRHRSPGRWPPARRGRPGRSVSRRPRRWNADPPRVACPRVYTRAMNVVESPGPAAPRSRARSCPRRRSASSAAASSGGCSASRPGRWATGSRSSTRIPTARPPPSPTSWSSGRTTTSRRRCGSAERQRRRHLRAGARRGRRRRGASRRWSRSGPVAAAASSTQDRLAERRFVEAPGSRVAPWREVRSTDELRAAAAPDALGLPAAAQGRRSAATTAAARSGSPSPADLDDASARLGREPRARRCSPSASSTSSWSCRSSSRARIDGSTATFPIARNLHDAGILVESVAPAPVADGDRGRGRRDRPPPGRRRWT